MPDYASILKRSISGLGDPSPEMREAVYQRARAALARQLTAVDPPLSNREIELQHQELEEAVARLEAEFAPASPPPPAAAGFSDLEGKGDDFFATPEPTQPARAQTAAPTPMGGVTPASGRGYEDDDDSFEDEEERRGGRLPLVIAALAVVLLLIGGGAYLYSQWDSAGSAGGAEDQIAAAESSDAAPAAEDSDKRDDRLTNGTEAPPPAAAIAPPPAPAAPAGDSAPAPITSSNGLPLEDLASLSQQNSQTPDSTTNLVEQRAIYYFQGSEGQPGQANEGTATWTEITKDNRPAIQASLKIPERNVTVTVTIYKNYDPALPASHLVEVQFFGSLSESPVQRVPALVLKQTEQARGQPLAGAAVPVTNELFWIALSSEEEDVSRNVQLLREGSWFDIPILFSDQTRALITFEKGIPGDKVFETVMATWTPS